MPLINLSKTERRRLSLFFVCLGVAMGAWLFFALSNRYVYQAKTLVRFIDFPQNKAFHSLQSDTVRLQIEGTGWQLLFSRLRINPQSIDVNLKDLNKRNYITFSEQLNAINGQLESNQKVVYVQPDTLYFDFSARSIKKVPVRVSHDISFKKRYGISGRLIISPEYVTITGPYEDLVMIDSWETSKISLKDVHENISARVGLKTPSKPNINVLPSVVDVSIPVDEFTELKMEVPVKVINNVGFRKVKLLPARVTITLLTALSNFPEIKKSSIEAVVNLEDWQSNNNENLKVNLRRFPAYCKLLKIEPQNIDFIISE